MSLPLAGRRIIDLTRALAGPYCTAMLADLGADVIKVEAPPRGDVTRTWAPYADGSSLYFMSTNRNKRSIALDLRDPAEQETLRSLVRSADAVLDNFRPGVLKRIGLDPNKLREEQPDLIVARITGFGPVGPMKNDAGLDQVAQGMSGLMSVTGPKDREPHRVGIPIIDILTGCHAAVGIAAALGARHGGRIEVSLLESAINVMTFQAQRFLSSGEVASPEGNDHPMLAPYGVFATADVPINICVGTDKQWQALCAQTGLGEAADDPRYADAASRTTNRDAVRALLEQRLAHEPAAVWLDRLRSDAVPCGPIYEMDQVFADPQVDALGVVEKMPSPGGQEMPLLRGPFWVDGQPTSVRRPPPQFDEHRAEILDELRALERGSSQMRV